MSTKAIIDVIREDDSNTGQIIVACPNTKKCAIIDSVLNYNITNTTVSTTSADELIEFCKSKGYTIEWAIDTHIHADHLTATYYIKKQTGAKTAIGEHVTEVQQHFQKFFNLPTSYIEGEFWDHLFKHNEKFQIGDLNVQVLHTPGHTPACLTYYIENDALITGDTIFMPDMGTARCDFPGGSVNSLWDSVQTILALPKEIRVFVGHDYSPNGRDWNVETTLGKQLEENKHVKAGTSQEEFTEFRSTRDAQLGLPKLLYPAMQFNIRGGCPPPAENENMFIKMVLSVPFN